MYSLLLEKDSKGADGSRSLRCTKRNDIEVLGKDGMGVRWMVRMKQRTRHGRQRKQRAKVLGQIKAGVSEGQKNERMRQLDRGLGRQQGPDGRGHLWSYVTVPH